MNGESTYKPDFITVENEQTLASDNKVEANNNENLTNDLQNSSADLTDSEVKLIHKQRQKLRLFDPEDVYNFRHIEIGYFQSFLHVISLCISIFSIIGFSYLIINNSQQLVKGIGMISDLNVLDKLCMSFIALYSLFKIKKTLTTKATNFDKRYRIAICANSLNLIVLNYLKLSLLFLALMLTFIQVEYTDETVSSAVYIFENGVVADSLSIITWFIFIVMVVKAFKYCGKGEIK
ncbi:hypothetical protein [Colwellia polaris]|uniref:hypothetical protein n=1 Tax=Colwellia polaris TaxID=326537 RepID=UPI000A171874|nr:hypothetical protein [Colwellia polaris]